MLKWTVLPRRDTDVLPRPLTSSAVTTPRKTKRRRSSASRRSSVKIRGDALDADKENRFSEGENHFYRSRVALTAEVNQQKEDDGNPKRQFTSSTPIKSNENLTSSKRPKHKEEDTFWRFDVLRDVSNLTPNSDRGVILKKKCKSEPKRFERLHQKKKKDCLNLHHSESDSFFKPFEAVDSHIESILADKLCSCKKVDLLEKPPPELNDASPPSKKLKTTDNFDDFLRRISLLTSPEDPIKLPGLRLTQNNVNFFQKEAKKNMSPLVRKFLDLKFEKNRHNDSSLINNMSLDKIVDAILEQSTSSTVNTSMIVNLEDNVRNKDQQSMSDSGFKSTNSHRIDENSNSNNVSEKKIVLPIELLDKTVIPINVTFNERYVGEENVSTRKRSSSSPVNVEVTASKRLNLENSAENCTLKRQKCVRRRKTFSCKNFSPFWYSSKKFATICDDSFENFDNPELDNNMEIDTPLRGCYLENKEILKDETFIIDTPSKSSNGIRRCLLFESPKINESESLSESIGGSVDVRGTMDLKIFVEDDSIVINVIRCKDLYRPNGESINAYVKVAIADRLSKIRKNKSAFLQRTTVQSNSSRPFFNQTFKFSKNAVPDNQKRIHIEVWHRDRILKSSEFLGCMSFDVRDAFGKGISGTYRLLSQSTGRSNHVPIATDSCKLLDNEKMGESQTGSVEEVISLDDLEHDLKKPTTKAALVEQQKHADENLFLRYLELDPTEGPDAIPAATQRKATGNKSGRTPFTQTKRLVRPAGKSGFGFSVVWTHPPRIERVEKGLPADKAGILPGDYIIFVDKHNVVMMPEIDILNLIRSYGSQLTLEIFRRNPSRNGSLPSVRKITSALATSSSIPNDSNTNIPGVANNNSASVTTVNIQGASNMMVARRPSSTACSTNTASADYNRKKLHLPQVTFTAEKPATTPEENRKKAMYQLINKEQQYATAMQFAITRFVSALSERKDLISQSEHRILFQNCEEVLRLTEEMLEHLVNEDGEPQIQLLVRIYRAKCHDITSTYKKYCSGIKKADCVLANKMKNQNSDFVRFVQIPAVPRRRPDITTFIHKPLDHYREMLKLLLVIQSHTKSHHEDFHAINQVIHELQVTYRVITSEAGLMEPVGEGRPLLSVQDLENRLVFTKCKPFVLNKPGRQWIFGGDLSRVEGRNVRQYWALLFSDLLLFAKVSRDRVLFIIEDPLPLTHITDMFFNVRKKDTEFRIMIHPEGNKAATSPTVHCGPDLSRTPRKNAGKKTVILRAPTVEMKAVWQNLLQRQIFHLTSLGTDGSTLSSPNLDSPDVPITSSVVTLQSAEMNHHHNHQVRLKNVIALDTYPHLDLSSIAHLDTFPVAHLDTSLSHLDAFPIDFTSLDLNLSSIDHLDLSSLRQKNLEDFPSLTKTPDTPSANISSSTSPSASSQAGFTSRFTSDSEMVNQEDVIRVPHGDNDDDFFGDETWDISQFDYDLSCLNIDGISQGDDLSS